MQSINQNTLSDETAASIAASLSLDMTQFRADLQDPNLQALVESDQALGDQFGLTATPTFFLNGVKLDVRTPDELKKKVEEAITK